MDEAARRRLLDAIEQARDRADDALRGIEADPDAPAGIASAIKEARDALVDLAEDLREDS